MRCDSPKPLATTVDANQRHVSTPRLVAPFAVRTGVAYDPSTRSKK